MEEERTIEERVSVSCGKLLMAIVVLDPLVNIKMKQRVSERGGKKHRQCSAPPTEGLSF